MKLNPASERPAVAHECFAWTDRKWRFEMRLPPSLYIRRDPESDFVVLP